MQTPKKCIGQKRGQKQKASEQTTKVNRPKSQRNSNRNTKGGNEKIQRKPKTENTERPKDQGEGNTRGQ